ncbi:ubiquitin ligase [Cotia virus SPAn232]|uniref:Ubiquitin ligase n=2 Tax=Cotia virus TaxID=39444 RepID=H6TAC3_9POXV|nr:ubiquitin ligase [Cotia virus SPAn232]AFB76957.1 ubiquitin ligase [Cotia virus SPAn232]AIT70770.1 ubiquitin ligase [Cotia virus]
MMMLQIMIYLLICSIIHVKKKYYRYKMDILTIETVNMSNYLIISNTGLDFNIVIMKHNEYINISKMYNIKKKYNSWKRLKNTINVIKNICEEENINIKDSSIRIYVNKLNKDISGVFIHPKIFTSFINWYSSIFANKFANVIEMSNISIMKNIDYCSCYEYNIIYKSIINNDKCFEYMNTNASFILDSYNQLYIESSKEICSVCMDYVLSKPKNYFGIITCNHIFCIECISIWFKNNNTCPVCRKKIYHITKSIVYLKFSK